MPLIELAPHEKILRKIKETLDAVDFQDRAGLEQPLTVRHWRGRATHSSEMPCLAIRWLGSDPQEIEDQYKNNWERQKMMPVDLVIDAPLPDEDDADADDQTGWARLSRIGSAALEALKDEYGPLAQWCDFVADSSLEADEESKPDNGRLVQGVSVIYRVRTDAPNVLLAPGENA